MNLVVPPNYDDLALVPEVSEHDKNELVAYNQAYKRLKLNIPRWSYSNTNVNPETDKLTVFTLKKSTKDTNKKIMVAFLTDMMQEADLVALLNKCSRWQIITNDRVTTKSKLVKWASYFNLGNSMYLQEETNSDNNSSLFWCNFYRLDDLPMIEHLNAGYYAKNLSKMRTHKTRLDYIYNLGYLMSRRRTPEVVRPKAANKRDVEFVSKLLDFYNVNLGQDGGSGLRSDLRNTIRRCVNNYDWPDRDKLLHTLF